MPHILNMFKFLAGYRTYILVSLGAVAWAASALGYISPDIFQQILTILGIGAVGSLRAAIK